MELKETFNSKAEQYEKSRPTYKGDIINIILKHKHLDSSSRILEIGCGTGKATELFAPLPSKIHCIDIGENLIKIAQNKFSKYPNIDFEVAQFENYQSNIKYDLIFSATAYHWIKQPDGDLNVQKLLNENGIFVLMHNMHMNKDRGFFLETHEIYQKHATEPKPKQFKEPLINTKYFHLLEKYEYFWTEEYSTEAYLNLLSTHSDHIALPENKRNELFNDLKTLINQKYDGKVSKEYKTLVEIGKSLK